jgi:hypothetical protein
MPKLTKYLVEGFFTEPPKPVYREGMSEQLLIISWNGMDLFILEEGKYRTSTQEEYDNVRNTKVRTEEIPASRLSPFPQK